MFRIPVADLYTFVFHVSYQDFIGGRVAFRLIGLEYRDEVTAAATDAGDKDSLNNFFQGSDTQGSQCNIF